MARNPRNRQFLQEIPESHALKPWNATQAPRVCFLDCRVVNPRVVPTHGNSTFGREILEILA